MCVCGVRERRSVRASGQSARERESDSVRGLCGSLRALSGFFRVSAATAYELCDSAQLGQRALLTNCAAAAAFLLFAFFA